MGGWVRWLVAGCAAGGLATACGAAGFSWGVRASDARARPTRAYTVSTDPRKVREIRFLRDLVMQAAEDRDRLERAVLAGERDGRLRDAQRAAVTRAGVAAVRAMLKDGLHSPMWLPGTYRVHERPDCWVVEGIVLESQGSEDAALAYFWAVEVARPAGGVATPYRPRRIVFCGHVHEDMKGDGEWVRLGKVRIDPDAPYPRLDYGP